MYGKTDQQNPPFTIPEVEALYEDIKREITHESNFKQVLMESADEFLHQLRGFIEYCEGQRISGTQFVKEELTEGR